MDLSIGGGKRICLMCASKPAFVKSGHILLQNTKEIIMCVKFFHLEMNESGPHNVQHNPTSKFTLYPNATFSYVCMYEV